MDGVLIPKDSSTDDYQLHLEKDILKLTDDACKQIIILSKSSYTPFMKLTTPKRREVIDALLDLEIFSKMSNLLKLKITSNNLEIQNNSKDIKSEENKLELVNSHIKNLDEEFDKKNEESLKQIKTFENTIKECESDLLLLEPKLDELKKKKEKLSILVKTEEKLNNKINEIKCEIEKLNNHKHLSGICPTCNQEISESIVKIEEEKRKQKIGILEVQIVKLQSQIDQLSIGLEDLKMVNIDISTNEGYIDQHKRTIEQEKYKIQILNENIKKQSYDKTKLLSSIDVIELRIKELNEEREKLLKEKAAHDVCVMLLKDNGIKATVIQNYIPEFNRLINKYLSDMNAFYSFELNENFDEKISSRHRDEFVYDNFSEGEKQRIDLAILFTWREIAKTRNSMSSNLVIFDEVLDGSLDGEGIDDLLKILSTLNGSIFVISHSSDMIEYFNKTIEIKKLNNFSEIEY